MLSPTAWLVVACVSVLLAGGSALLLATRTGSAPSGVPGKVFDSVEQFVRDTIRLSFKDRLYDDTSHSVFVAPRGILNQNATFKWIEPTQTDAPPGNAEPPIAIAPPRVLDPDWAPPFSAITTGKREP